MEHSMEEIRELQMEKDIKELFENRLDVSNRLIKIETILENQSITLHKILEQTTKTNGRVNSLELWREKMLGINIGVTIIISAVVTVVGIAISIFLK